jgi:ATP-dependent Clp protease ATP-binding subunit ClpA
MASRTSSDVAAKLAPAVAPLTAHSSTASMAATVRPRRGLPHQGEPSSSYALAVFERFTDSARQAVVNAQEEARELGHGYIASEHLILGVARVDGGLLRVDEARLRAAVVAALGESMKLVEGWIPFTPEAQSGIEHALGVALERGDSHIGPTQLLLALLDQEAIRSLVRTAGAAPEEVVARLASSVPTRRRDGDLGADANDARLLLAIALRDRRVAAWLREHGVDEAAIRARFGALDLD